MTTEHKDPTPQEIEDLLCNPIPWGDILKPSDISALRGALLQARRYAEAEAASRGDMERTAKAIQLVAEAQKRADEWKHLAGEWEATTQRAMERVKELTARAEKAEARVKELEQAAYTQRYVLTTSDLLIQDRRRQERVQLAAAALSGDLGKTENGHSTPSLQEFGVNPEGYSEMIVKIADAVLAQLDRTEVKTDGK